MSRFSRSVQSVPLDSTMLSECPERSTSRFSRSVQGVPLDSTMLSECPERSTFRFSRSLPGVSLVSVMLSETEAARGRQSIRFRGKCRDMLVSYVTSSGFG